MTDSEFKEHVISIILFTLISIAMISQYLCNKIELIYIGPWVLQRGSLVIALVRWSVGWSVFKYLRDRSLFFSSFLHELEDHNGTKVAEPDFWKKNLRGSQMGEKPHFGSIFDVFVSLHPVIKNFWNFICIISLTLSNI